MQCSNHLNQLGIAVHNFNSAKNGLPPLLICGNGGNSGVSTNNIPSPTVFVYLLPYLEKQTIYDLFPEDFVNTPVNNAWWDAIPDKNLMIIPTYICPSRGPRIANNPGLPAITATMPLTDGTASASAGGGGGGGGGNNPPAPDPEDRAMDGFVSDYVVVMSDPTRPTALSDRIARHYDIEDYNQLRIDQFGSRDQVGNCGGLRAALNLKPLRYGEAPQWTVRETMSYYKDGTSNQYIFAEKHIPSDRLGKCFSVAKTGAAAATQWGWWDCGVHMSRVDEVPHGGESANENNLLLYSPGRTLFLDTYVIASEPSEGVSTGAGAANNPNLWKENTNVSALGSYHTGGICLHLFADGSVHEFSPNVSREKVHWSLGCVLDGAAVDFE
jgi:hypothetical protein